LKRKLPQAEPRRLIRGESEEIMKDNYIRIRISTELKQAAQEAAKQDGRTLANWIEQLVKQAIKKESE
jgi:predicted HicB family RNase H-like nuclease